MKLNPLLPVDNTFEWRGFSLLELMLVVAITALLSTAALPQFRDYWARSQQLDAQQGLLDLMQQQQHYYSQYRRYNVLSKQDQDLYGADMREGTTTSFTSKAGYYFITSSTCEDDHSDQCVLLTATPKAINSSLMPLSLDSKNRRRPEASW
ncbi:MAG: type IV pilin protein [Gammaproteobacteria bacterium]|nr:type IV pilin protein [Gammaproteobacteria bacterium]